MKEKKSFSTTLEKIIMAVSSEIEKPGSKNEVDRDKLMVFVVKKLNYECESDLQ